MSDDEEARSHRALSEIDEGEGEPGRERGSGRGGGPRARGEFAEGGDGASGVGPFEEDGWPTPRGESGTGSDGAHGARAHGGAARPARPQSAGRVLRPESARTRSGGAERAGSAGAGFDRFGFGPRDALAHHSAPVCARSAADERRSNASPLASHAGVRPRTLCPLRQPSSSCRAAPRRAAPTREVREQARPGAQNTSPARGASTCQVVFLPPLLQASPNPSCKATTNTLVSAVLCCTTAVSDRARLPARRNDPAGRLPAARAVRPRPRSSAPIECGGAPGVRAARHALWARVVPTATGRGARGRRRGNAARDSCGQRARGRV